MPPRSIAILAAMRQELRPLAPLGERAGVRLLRTGVGLDRAREAARRLGPADLVISTGCCGGLVDGARSGMLSIPSQVHELCEQTVLRAPPPDDTLALEARRLADGLRLSCSGRPSVSVAHGLTSEAQKRACHELTGAVTVDMETAAIAREAAQRGVPYLAIRVVLDTVREELPAVSDPERGVRPRDLVRVVRKPVQAVSLASLGLRLRRSSRDLCRCIEALLEHLAR